MKQSKFKWNYIDYKTFGKCLKIITTKYTLIISTMFGPRILFFGPNDKFNFLFEDIKDVFHMSTKKHQKLFKKEAWHCYGGHRLWASPENILTYAPDNRKLDIKIEEGQIIINAPVLPVSFLKIRWELTINPQCLIIKHIIINASNKTHTLAPWSLTQMAPNGTAVFKFNSSDTGFLPNRRLIVWPYTNLNDPRLFLGDKYCSLKMNPKNKRALKLGMDNESGQASYILNNYQFTISYKHKSNGEYPDYGCSLETYTNNHFLEIETLGPMAKLASKQSISHEEKWKIKKANNNYLSSLS